MIIFSDGNRLMYRVNEDTHCEYCGGELPIGNRQEIEYGIECDEVGVFYDGTENNEECTYAAFCNDCGNWGYFDTTYHGLSLTVENLKNAIIETYAEQELSHLDTMGDFYVPIGIHYAKECNVHGSENVGKCGIQDIVHMTYDDMITVKVDVDKLGNMVNAYVATSGKSVIIRNTVTGKWAARSGNHYGFYARDGFLCLDIIPTHFNYVAGVIAKVAVGLAKGSYEEAVLKMAKRVK